MKFRNIMLAGFLMYAAVAGAQQPQQAPGTAYTWHYEAGNRRFGESQLEVWAIHPDSREHPGVPKGTVKQMPPWESRIFEGTKRDW